MLKPLTKRADFGPAEGEADDLQRLALQVERKRYARWFSVIIALAAAAVLIGWPGAWVLYLVGGRSSAILLVLCLCPLVFLHQHWAYWSTKAIYEQRLLGKTYSSKWLKRQRFWAAQGMSYFLVTAVMVGALGFVGQSNKNLVAVSKNKDLPLLTLEQLLPQLPAEQQIVGGYESFSDLGVERQFRLSQLVVPREREQEAELPPAPVLALEYYQCRSLRLAEGLQAALLKEGRKMGESAQTGKIVRDYRLLDEALPGEEIWVQERSYELAPKRIFYVLYQYDKTIITLRFRTDMELTDLLKQVRSCYGEGRVR